MNATPSMNARRGPAPDRRDGEAVEEWLDAGDDAEHDDEPGADSAAADDEAALRTEAAVSPPAGEALPRGSAGAGVDDARLAAWIDAIVDHDDRALSALYDATVNRVHALVLRVVRRPALAEEVVEDTFFQVWRQAARFDAARGRPMTWLLGMARSRAIDALRRESRFEHESLDAEHAVEVEDERPAADELLDTARCHADLHRALLLLNAQPRQLVALAFLRGMSHEEIAEHTTLPLGTVKSQIRRALITLRSVLGPQRGQLLAI